MDEELAHAEFPAVVNIDIHRPSVGGLEAIHRLKANPVPVATPSTELTALAMPRRRERF